VGNGSWARATKTRARRRSLHLHFPIRAPFYFVIFPKAHNFKAATPPLLRVMCERNINRRNNSIADGKTSNDGAGEWPINSFKMCFIKTALERFNLRVFPPFSATWNFVFESAANGHGILIRMFQVRGTISRRGLFQEIFTPTSCSMLSTQLLAFTYTALLLFSVPSALSLKKPRRQKQINAAAASKAMNILIKPNARTQKPPYLRKSLRGGGRINLLIIPGLTPWCALFNLVPKKIINAHNIISWLCGIITIALAKPLIN
jgi:hypothetical protein